MTKSELISLVKIKDELQRRKKETALKNYAPHLKQFAFHTALPFIRWITGGNRSGKTESATVETIIRSTGEIPTGYMDQKYIRKCEQLGIGHPDKSLAEVYSKPINLPSDNWIVTADFPNARDVVIPMFRKYIPPGYIKRWWQTDKIWEIKNGSRVSIKSCDSGVRKFFGPKKDNVQFDEEPANGIYDECYTRVADSEGQLYGAMTPMFGITWTKEEFLNKMDIDPDIFCINFDIDDNPYLSDESRARLKKKFTGVEADIRLHGTYTSRTGLVYGPSYWDDLIHLIDPFVIPKHWLMIGILDPGLATTGYLLAAVSPENKKYLVGEHYGRDLTIPENAKYIKQLWGHFKKPDLGLIDPASEQRDPVTKKKIRQLYASAGVTSICAKNAIFPGIEKVWEALTLAREDKPGGTKVFRNLINFRHEREKYSWARLKLTSLDTPDDGHQNKPALHQKDHLMDAWRYFEMYDSKYIAPNELALLGFEGENNVVNGITGY